MSGEQLDIRRTQARISVMEPSYLLQSSWPLRFWLFETGGVHDNSRRSKCAPVSEATKLHEAIGDERAF